MHNPTNDIPEFREADTNTVPQVSFDCPAAPAKGRIRTIVILIIAASVLFIGFLTAVCGFVLYSLQSEKDSEEYKLAYSYLVTSDAFAELHAEESKILMNSYSLNTCRSDGENVTQTATFGFLVHSRSFEVVCHNENDVWRVCTECTTFD